MPIAELLGVQFDMQLLSKLSLSVAAVLLVSWAYRFYNSRDANKLQLCDKDKDKAPQNATCQNCKTTLRCQCSPKHNTDDGDEQLRPSDKDSETDDLTSDSTKETPAAEDSEDAFSMSYSDQHISIKGEMLAHQKQAVVSTSNISYGSALNLPHPTESGMSGTTGRRSPCFLQKLEGSVGVSRELRQDLEHQGAYSIFLSKAEIKVEDANLVLKKTGDHIVRGKIYDYYVESSSHSITDSKTVLGQYERNTESQPVELGSHSSSRFTESPSSLSPVIMHDLVLPQSTAEDPSSLRCLKLRPPARRVLLRKESYLSAAEQSELSMPFVTPSASTTMTHSLASTSDDSITIHPKICPSTHSKDHNVREGSDLAGVLFSAKTLDGADLESLKSRLDLGNCLEVLCMAKQHGHTSVQQAALGVMSDNYLQVLRDPNLYGRLMAGEREQIRKQRLRGRNVYRYHTVARLWYECSSKRLLRCPAFQCATMDDTIYCVNRQFTTRFEADEISPAFRDEDLSVLSAAKGILFPFVLSLPDKKPRQTSV
ncbi:hypothetical protein PAMA_010232 [Pampus argenteus]